MRIGTIALALLGLFAFEVASPDDTPANSGDLEKKVNAVLRDPSGGEETRTQRLVELGQEAAPAICSASEKGKISRSQLKALGRLGNPAVNSCLLEHLQEMRRTQRVLRRDCIRALRRCHAENALWDLLEIMWEGKDIRDARSYELSLALDAAAAVRVLGKPNERAEAQSFILAIMREVPTGMEEDLILTSLMIGLTQCDSREGLDFIAEHLGINWVSEDLVASLPRNAGHKGLVEGVYKQLTHVAYAMGEEPTVEMACLEALSEMDLTPEVVPEGFWQKHWNARCAHLVGHGEWYRTPEKITPDMFNARHRAFMEKMHIVWDPEAVNKK